MIDKPANFTPAKITPAELEARRQGMARPPVPADGAFAGALRAAESSRQPDAALRFSAHAEDRLRARDIRLSANDTAQINQAIEIAHAKGANESLILYDDLALIVSIRNRTVITALERGESQANVFTHIDSAVVMPGSRS